MLEVNNVPIEQRITLDNKRRQTMKTAKNRLLKILPVLALVAVFQSVIATSPQVSAQSAVNVSIAENTQLAV